MAPPTVTGMSVQFQPMMQSQQVVENHQIIDQQPQSNFQTQIQHMNQTMQQQINENQQKINGIPFSVQNVPQPVPYPQQVLYWVFYPQLLFFSIQKTHSILQKKTSSSHFGLSAFKIGRFWLHDFLLGCKTTITILFQQLEEQRMGLKRKRLGDDDQGPLKHLLPPRMGIG